MVGKAVKGSMPTDDGNLVIEPEEYETVMADPVAAKYVRRYVGSRELLHNLPRWCLWLDNMDPQDLSRSRILRERVEAVRQARAESKAATTREAAAYPHLFRQPATWHGTFLCIPSVVSETRPYFTTARLDEKVIASNLAFIADDPDGFQFAIISSSMFITWQKTVGGRLESRLRFGSTLSWYTFPVPNFSDADRARIIEAGQAVVQARELHPDRSLADHYNPLAMDRNLIKAHDKLDAVVDRAFGAKRTCTSEKERQEILFARYADLTK
jgi:hypothetical protein